MWEYLGKQKPGNWLYDIEEEGQSFEGWLTGEYSKLVQEDITHVQECRSTKKKPIIYI